MKKKLMGLFMALSLAAFAGCTSGQEPAQKGSETDSAQSQKTVKEETAMPDSADKSLDISELTNSRIAQLEYELGESNWRLSLAMEESESRNEELQATNEELMASNEELQSTNEEMQSINENDRIIRTHKI